MVTALRMRDAVAWCGRRMPHHVYSHFLCGVPSWQLQRHYSEHYLSQKGTKERERKAVLFSLYIWMLKSRLRYFAAGRRASAKDERKKGSIKKTSPRAQAGACWEELHSAAAHASLSQRPSLSKVLTSFRWGWFGHVARLIRRVLNFFGHFFKNLY